MAKIVYAEDDNLLRGFVQRILGQREHEVQATEDGAAALELITEETELVMTDGRMPEMSGYELVREMEKRGYTIPVLFNSADANIDLPKYGGKIEIVAKPVGSKEIYDAIDRLLE